MKMGQYSCIQNCDIT